MTTTLPPGPAVLPATAVRPADLERRLHAGLLPLHAPAQRFNTLHEQKGVERAHARAQVAKSLDATFDDDRHLAERFAKAQIMIARTGFD